MNFATGGGRTDSDIAGHAIFSFPATIFTHHGSGTCDCKLSSSDSRCSGVYQYDQGPSSLVPVSYRPNFACSAYLHRLPVQCASFSFSAFLGDIYNRISYHGMHIAPIRWLCWLELNFLTVLGRRSPFTFPSGGPTSNALFVWSSYKLYYCSSFRYLAFPLFPWCMYCFSYYDIGD